MESAPKRSSEHPPLNPLALPSETEGRYRMLMIVAIILVWSLPSRFIEVLNIIEISLDRDPGLQSLIEQMSKDLDAGQPSMPSPSQIALILESPTLKKFGMALSLQLLRIKYSLLFLISLLATALVIYRSTPKVLKWIYRLEGRPAAGSVIGREISGLSTIAGIPKPEIAIRPGMLDGLAFGDARRPVLAISAASGNLDRPWTDLDRAVALHEMAHIANGDIHHREKVRSVWIAAIAVLIGGSCWLHRQGFTWTNGSIFAWQTLGILVFAWGLWSGLVRSRELYADWRVITWGLGEALARRLKLPAAWEFGSRPWDLRRLWRLHPSNRARLEAMRDSTSLFAVSPSLAVLTGCLLGMLAGNAGPLMMDCMVLISVFMTTLMVLVQEAWLTTFAIAILALPILGAFALSRWVSEALGIQVLRAGLRSLAPDRRGTWGYAALFGPALLFVLGLEGGLLLTGAARLEGDHRWLLDVWRAGLVLLVWVWLAQTHALGRLLLGACTSGSSARRAIGWLRWLSSIQFAAFAVPALAGRFSAGWVMHPSPNTASFSPAELLAYWGFVLLKQVILGTTVAGFALFAILTLWLHCRSVHCQHCGRLFRGWRAVGRRCDACGHPAASWLLGEKGTSQSSSMEEAR